jgi:hypothetical protein
MSERVKHTRPRREQADPEALARLVEITKESADHLILADGPVSPDAELLDQAAEALHLMTQAERLYDEHRELLFGRRKGSIEGKIPWNSPEAERRRADAHAIWDEAEATTRKAKPIMRALAKQSAKTAAGIYAKALIVRGSRTGAEVLAMSLASDLVALPALRARLWQTEAAQ